VFPSAEVGANTTTHTQVLIRLRMRSEVFLTFPTIVKAHHDTSQAAAMCQARIPPVILSLGGRDTNQLWIPRSRRSPGEAIPSLEGPGTNHHLYHPALLRAGIQTRSRELTDTNLPLLPDSRLHRPALLHQPRARVMSSPMYARTIAPGGDQLKPFEFRERRSPSSSAIFVQCGPN